MLELHYWPTPNGRKVTILLEELGVAHKIVPMNIGRGDQFNPEILRFSPNNRMPALVDTAVENSGVTSASRPSASGNSTSSNASIVSSPMS